MGPGRICDNSTLIGLGGDCPSNEAEYFINTSSSILFNFLWCGIYYTQLPDGQLTTEKCMVVPKAQERLCARKKKVGRGWLMESLIHLLLHSLIHSTGDVETPLCVRRWPQDSRRTCGWIKYVNQGCAEGRSHEHRTWDERPSHAALQIVMYNKNIAGSQNGDVTVFMFVGE